MYKIKNWEKFNLYNTSNPKYRKEMTWFKIYGRDVLNNLDWFQLTSDQKSTLFELWCLASQDEGKLPSVDIIAFRLRKDKDFIINTLESLKDWLCDLSTQSLEEVYPSDALDKIRENKIISIVRFEEFWKEYPANRKVGKKPCMDKWTNKKLDNIADKIIAHVKAMKQSKQWKDGFNPAPLTYINQERWEDGIEKVRSQWDGVK
jgi:hypothetical protein